MENTIIVVIIALLAVIGVWSAVKHFKGRSSCCGGGGDYVSKKKVSTVVAKKVFLVEGMTCDHCKARVLRAVNDLDGAAGEVRLKKGEVLVRMDRQIPDETIRAAIEKAGYTVTSVT